MNIEQMTQKTREALQAAQRIAVEYSNNAVEQEHLLVNVIYALKIGVFENKLKAKMLFFSNFFW